MLLESETGRVRHRRHLQCPPVALKQRADSASNPEGKRGTCPKSTVLVTLKVGEQYMQQMVLELVCCKQDLNPEPDLALKHSKKLHECPKCGLNEDHASPLWNV